MTFAEDSWTFREGLRRDLRAALKSRELETISALRTLIAAIDNAEAIPPSTASTRPADSIVAQSSPGVGSTEAPRRDLAMTDVQAIVRELFDEYQTQGERYHLLRQPEASGELRRKANIVRVYLDT